MFSREVVRLYRQYFTVQQESQEKQKFMKDAFKVINEHEKIICEMRSFIDENLAEFLKFVEEKHDGVCNRFRYMNL